MKKIYLLILASLFCIGSSFAQTPNAFKYQAVVRDNNGQPIANKLVAIKLSLLINSTNGSEIYSETHTIATNEFGVANLVVGAGNANNGNFNTIDWGAGTYFLKTEIDVNNGNNFSFLGTSQLLSVPYALYAGKSANAADDFDKDSINEIQNIALNGNNLTLSKNGGNVDLTKLDKDSQQLVLNGNTLSITCGNSIVLSSVVDLDADPTNEIQNLSLVNDTLKISKANFIKLPKDNDSDSTNEIQTLSVNQNKLSISKSNLVNIDADTTNEIQSLSFSNDTLKISKQLNIAAVPSTATVQSSRLQYATASGTNTIALTIPTTINAYTPGMIINFKASNNNTGPVQINLNGLGNKNVFKNISNPLDSNDFRTNQMVSIIYDGINFQCLVSPFAKTAEKSNKLSSDTIGGLVPKNALILTESPIAPQGYISNGKTELFPARFELVNSDLNPIKKSSYIRAIGYPKFRYIGNQNGNPYFIETVFDSIKVYYLDTINKNLIRIGSNYKHVSANCEGFKEIFGKLYNSKIFIACTYTSSNPQKYYGNFDIIEYNLTNNSWNILSQNIIGGIGCGYNNPIYLKIYEILNNALYFELKDVENGYFLFNQNNSNDNSILYQYDISTKNIQLIGNNFFVGKARLINNSIYRATNYGYNDGLTYFDSIYKLNSNLQWQFLNKIPAGKLSGASAALKNDWLIGEYRYDVINNMFLNRYDYSKINDNENWLFVGEKIYIGDTLNNSIFIGDTLNFNFTEIKLENNPVFDDIIKFFSNTNEYTYCLHASGVISKMYFPKILYYHRKQ